MADCHDDYLVVGRIAGLYGVRGWVKVYSHTQPRDNILGYSPWYLREASGQWRKVLPLNGRIQGKGLVAQLEGCDERDAAARLIGQDIAIRREQLPTPQEGEYYWTDLIGLEVETVDGVALGVVDHLLETGANDVLVVKGERERLIPYIWRDVVTEVDLEAGRLRVDWDPDF